MQDRSVFNVIERSEVKSVIVDGDVDLTNSGVFEAMIEGAAAQAPRIVVDLAACSYLDSSGLGVLIRCYNAHGDRIRIVLPQDGGARRVFDITGLSSALPAFESFDDAARRDVGAAQPGA
jgi:anti-sigma B factor antagonist